MFLYRQFTTQEEIDREYRTDQMVENAKTYFDQMVSLSQQAQKLPHWQMDVPYGPTVDETMDICWAPSVNNNQPPNRPIMLFIHGGYWRLFSSKEFSFAAMGLIKHGISVAVLNYSLCPTVSIDEITRQSRAAVAYLVKAAVRPAGKLSIYICGHSAGGQQSAMLLQTDWEKQYRLDANLIKAYIPISGVFDLSPLMYSWLQPKLLLNHQTIMRQSPLLTLQNLQYTQKIPKIKQLVVVGGAESAEFIRQSSEYHQLSQDKLGVESNLWVQENKNHYDIITQLADAESELVKNIKNLVEATCV